MVLWRRYGELAELLERIAYDERRTRHAAPHPGPCRCHACLPTQPRVSRGFGASVRPAGGVRLPARYGSGQGAPGPG